MTVDEKYMWRCLQLAAKGKGQVSPNPMVGAVIVHDDKIIGEGYHRKYGQAHAEVNAINAVKDRGLLSESTIYVSLEPCSHYGKTPPCAELIIKSGIPKVVIASVDPFPSVSGRGMKMLKDAGIEVVIGVLEQEAKELNKEFFTAQISKRPYIYLKWAQSRDGYIDGERSEQNPFPAKLSTDFTQILVHKLRAGTDAIMIGTNTAIKDNPHLTSRLWNGKNPIRIIIDRTGRIPGHFHLFDNKVDTIVFSEMYERETTVGSVTYVPMVFDEFFLKKILHFLYEKKIRSVMVEGGSRLLQTVIDQNLWDSAFLEIADKKLTKGIIAPQIDGIIEDKLLYNDSLQLKIRSR